MEGGGEEKEEIRKEEEEGRRRKPSKIKLTQPSASLFHSKEDVSATHE